MERIGKGVKGIVRKGDHFLVLVKPDGSLDLPGGRVEKGETLESALCREIYEETGLKVSIQKSFQEWSFVKTPNLLIKGITFVCKFLEGRIKLCEEHKNYYWVRFDKLHVLKFSREKLNNFRYT
jgi:8-oxo-dGTP diphosphatase